MLSSLEWKIFGNVAVFSPFLGEVFIFSQKRKKAARFLLSPIRSGGTVSGSVKSPLFVPVFGARLLAGLCVRLRRGEAFSKKFPLSDSEKAEVKTWFQTAGVGFENGPPVVNWRIDRVGHGCVFQHRLYTPHGDHLQMPFTGRKVVLHPKNGDGILERGRP